MYIKKTIRHIEKRLEEFADFAAHSFGTVWFPIIHAVWFAAWVIFQVEPFPYGLLTMIVSLESILLSGLILSATDRESERDRKVMNRDLRISKETQELLQHMHIELAQIKEYVTGEGEDAKK
jgi:CRP/FNR family transcriptional regulator, cyclic AMP receptor protein